MSGTGVQSVGGDAERRKAMQSRMGERADRTAMPERVAPGKRKAEVEAGNAAKRLKRGPGLLGMGETGDSSVYVPKSRDTQHAWEEFLSCIQPLLGDDEQFALRECAEEALAVLRNMNVPDVNKRKEVEEILEIRVDDSWFHRVLHLSKRMTDFVAPGAEDEEADDDRQDEVGVAVQFEESDDGSENYNDVAFEKSDSEDEADMDDQGGLRMKQREEDTGDADMNGDELDAKVIDAHWIQRTMGKLDDNEDPRETQARAEQVLEHLADAGKKDEEVETALTFLFQYQKFDFIKLCLNNRWKVVWCTKLARAKGEARGALVGELRGEPYGAAILEELAKGTDKADAETKAFRQEIQQQDREREVDRQGALLDLKELSFEEGAQTISNERTELPKGSTKAVHKGYEEYHIPAYKKKDVPVDDLVPIESLPKWCHPGFQGMKTLNPMQSKVYPGAFLRDDNILVCAPTGAGKTNVAMMTIMHELSKCVVDGEIDEDLLADVKIVYVAPMKALVQEVKENFGRRLKGFDMTVAELTGDVMMTKAEFVNAHVIVTTPEKWDIVTRKAGEKTYMQKVKLIIIDEVHLLHDTRGPVLEAIVARTLRMSEQTQEITRLVGLSATLPNYEDVATFMRVKKSADPAENGLYYFDAAHRPVPLEQQFVGISEKKPLKRRTVMNDIVYTKVMEQAGKQQMIIFVHSRWDTVATAKAIRNRAVEEEQIGRFVRDDEARKEILLEEAENNIKDAGLQNLLPYGFGVHHAGLSKDDRTAVEYLFDKGHLQVLVSTATLAWGVNLPAHRVIIKGTQIYNPEKGRWCELSPLDVIQMIGRAGRPQHDTKGEGIVITGASELKFYLSLLNRQLPIESHFINRLVDQLNAEIAMGSVQNTKEGVEWLAYSYLYVRMLRNPELYRVSKEEALDDPSLEQRRADLIHSAAATLEKAAMIRYDRRAGLFESTDLGQVCANYYLSAGTIIKFNEHLKPSMHELDLFRLFSMADEFQYMSVRAEEKVELTRLLEQVPVPVKESVDDPLAKTNVLLQAYISQLKLDGFALMADMVYITQSASRVIRAMFEMVLRRGWAQLSEKLLNMAKMVEKRTWMSHSPLRQFKNIPLDIILKLERKDFAWDRYYNLTPQDIATLVDNPKESKKIYKAVHQLPRLDLNATAQPITRSLLRIELLITADFQFDPKIHGSGESFLIVVEDPDQEQILHSEPFILQEKFAQEEHYLYFHVPIFDPMPPQYYVRVVSDRWLASETVLPVSFRRLILPEKSFSHTQLLDLTPLPIGALENKAYEALYPHVKHLNAIQTQVFQTLYKTDENTLVAAPAGSGKTLCAELALLRLFNENEGRRIRAVYCAPNQDTVDVVYKDWRRKFGEKLGKAVVLLTGETIGDLKLLEAGEVIMCTAQQWDQLSRRWQRRKNVTSVRLFIADECHMLATRNGPALEIVVSRMRNISAQLKDHKIRVVALSHSMLHARDVGLWIGTQTQSNFNFHPSARPVPLDIQIRGFSQPGFSARTMAMYKPTFTHIKTYAKDRPVIVFTPSKRITYDMVIELVTFCSTDANPRQFLHCDEADIEPHMELLTDKLLKKAFSYGIGFLEEGMTAMDKKIACKLFDSDIGILQVLVVPYTMCHQVDVSAHMVVLAGTQFYDGKEFRHADYALSDVLQMLGRAGRQNHDDSASAYIMCHTPQKEYLKRVMNDFYPIESVLDGAIIDHFNAECVAKTIESQQDAIDYLTWTFLYRRLRQNPNFYKMFGTSHEHISEYLSELVENSIKSLEQAGCVTVAMEQGEDGEEEVIEAANLGRIAAYYYIQYSTIELFASSVKDNSKIRQLIEIVSSATEFEDIPIRHHEDRKLERLSRHCGIKQQNLRFNEPATKVSLLLHAHFSRRMFSPELMADLQGLLPRAVPLLCALADVIGSERWLTPLLNCMELSQMVVQGLWDRDSVLLQLPHFTPELAGRCKAAGVETILDLVDMEDDDRNKLLNFTTRQMNAVAAACASYPNIEVNYQIPEADDLHEGSPVRVVVTLQRDLEDDEPVPKVYAPLFPQEKEESWWVVIGDKKANHVHAFKKVTVQRKNQVAVEFTAPKEGVHNLHLFFMCDCYIGVDQELPMKLSVGPPEESDEEDEEMEEEN